MTRRDDWIDDDEYPDDSDIDRFGDYSATDYDPLTIGRTTRRQREPFWTRSRIILAVIVVIILLSLLIPEILFVLNR